MFLSKWKDNYYLTYKWRSVHDNLLGKLAAYPDTRQGICSSWILINSNIWCRVRSMKSSPNKMQNTIANWTQTLGPTHIYLVSDNITFFFQKGALYPISHFLDCTKPDPEKLFYSTWGSARFTLPSPPYPTLPFYSYPTHTPPSLWSEYGS